jgi:hypothetical protein
MTPKTALLHTHKAPAQVTQAFDRIEGRDQRIELNLYVSGYEDEESPTGGAPGGPETPGAGAPESSGMQAQETAGEDGSSRESPSGQTDSEEPR